MTGPWIAVVVLMVVLVALVAGGVLALAMGRLHLDLGWGRSLHRLGPLQMRIAGAWASAISPARFPTPRRSSGSSRRVSRPGCATTASSGSTSSCSAGSPAAAGSSRNDTGRSQHTSRPSKPRPSSEPSGRGRGTPPRTQPKARSAARPERHHVTGLLADRAVALTALCAAIAGLRGSTAVSATTTTAERPAPEARWLTPGVRGIGGASLLADVGHEIPTSLSL